MKVASFINKSLWSGKRSALSVGNSLIASISVGISLFVVVLAITITDGFRWEIKRRATGLMGEIVVTSPAVEFGQDQYPINDSKQLIGQLQQVEGVSSATGYLFRRAIIKEQDALHGVLLKGVDDNFDWNFFNESLVAGERPIYSDSLTTQQILLPLQAAKILNVEVGESLLFYFIDNSVKARKLTISGIYNAHLEEVNESLVLTSARLIEELNGWGSDAVSGVQIDLKKGFKVEKTLSQIDTLLYDYPGTQNYVAYSVEKLFPHLFDWLNLLDFNVLIIIALMIAVAGFNMLSAVLILLLERISTIGLFKALGMRNREIHKLFLKRAAKLLLRGMAVGGGAGVVVALLQQRFKIVALDPTSYFVDFIPIHFHWIKIVAVATLSFITIILLLLLTSLFITTVSPDKSLRVK